MTTERRPLRVQRGFESSPDCKSQRPATPLHDSFLSGKGVAGGRNNRPKVRRYFLARVQGTRGHHRGQVPENGGQPVEVEDRVWLRVLVDRHVGAVGPVPLDQSFERFSLKSAQRSRRFLWSKQKRFLSKPSHLKLYLKLFLGHAWNFRSCCAITIFRSILL